MIFSNFIEIFMFNLFDIKYNMISLLNTKIQYIFVDNKSFI